jgi:hypothetical protein
MALPTLAKLKLYLRVEGTAEDEVLTDLLAQAIQWAQSLIGVPITAEQRTFYNVRPAFVGDGLGYGLSLPYPVASTPAPTVTDADGDAVPTTDYRVDSALGWFVPDTDYAFGEAGHTIVATVGLSAHPRYAAEIEPRVNALIIGLASVLYHERNPNASSESAGGGVSRSYRDGQLPPRLAQLAAGLRPVRL